MKKKILCYGNCQLAVIGNWLHEFYSDKFQVIDCKECGLEGFVGTKNFAVWSPENYPKQSEYAKCIHEKIKQVDVFLFHEMRRSVIPELTPKYLCSDIAVNSFSVCMPNSRFSAYPLCNMTPYKDYIYSIFPNERNADYFSEIAYDYFMNANDEKFAKILFEQHEASQAGNHEHEAQDRSYANHIQMSDYIEGYWDRFLLFITQNHPSIFYFNELIKRLFQAIGENLDEERLAEIEYPGMNEVYDLSKIYFFDNLYPNIMMPLNFPLRPINQELFLK